MTWLVTGGAGYIGGHVTRSLIAAGVEVVVLDDLSTGRTSVVPDGVPLVVADVGDSNAVRAALREHSVDGVLHLAAKKAVGESVARPLYYYRQNVDGMVSLLEAMHDEGVGRLVYSSSAAVYGAPPSNPIAEDTPLAPESPYGETKVIGEWLARSAAAAWDLSYVSLRYFNVVGAGGPGLGDVGVNNLVPLALRAITSGEPPRVFGDDYPTPDGTCVRDYVHVSDLAEAHALAVTRSMNGRVTDTFNVGRGEGSSVFEVLAMVAEVTGTPYDPRVVERRAGDPPALVAQADRIREQLGFTASRDLRAMVESAWEDWQGGGWGSFVR